MEDSVAHYTRLAELYASAPCNLGLDLELSIRHREATLTFPVRPEYLHAAGGLHGNYYFKLLDDAAFFAANSIVEGYWVLTASFHLHFLKPVTAGALRAVGRVTQGGKQMIFAESELRDADGRLVARGEGVFARSSIPLGEQLIQNRER